MSSRFKKITLIILTIFALIGGGIFGLYTTVKKTQTELNAIIEPMIVDMAAHQWDKNTIDKYASPALKQWMIDNKLTEGIPAFGALGSVKEYKGIDQFSATSNSATLVSSVQFERGDATVTIRLSKQKGVWLVDNLNVNSPLFLQGSGNR